MLEIPGSSSALLALGMCENVSLSFFVNTSYLLCYFFSSNVCCLFTFLEMTWRHPEHLISPFKYFRFDHHSCPNMRFSSLILTWSHQVLLILMCARQTVLDKALVWALWNSPGSLSCTSRGSQQLSNSAALHCQEGWAAQGLYFGVCRCLSYFPHRDGNSDLSGVCDHVCLWWLHFTKDLEVLLKGWGFLPCQSKTWVTGSASSWPCFTVLGAALSHAQLLCQPPGLKNLGCSPNKPPSFKM